MLHRLKLLRSTKQIFMCKLLFNIGTHVHVYIKNEVHVGMQHPYYLIYSLTYSTLVDLYLSVCEVWHLLKWVD